MPYIPKILRPSLENGNIRPVHAGELNFKFTSNITDYLTENGLTYSTINDVLGALEGAKLEFYRRVAVPYEDQKREQNGDVY